MSVPAPPPHVRVDGWTTTRVNQETQRVRDTAPVCVAIPVVAIAPRLRVSRARAGQRLRLSLRAPGHRPRGRTVVLRRRTIVLSPAFTPRDLRLRADAFEPGRHRLVVRAGGRTIARATLRFVPGGSC